MAHFLEGSVRFFRFAVGMTIVAAGIGSGAMIAPRLGAFVSAWPTDARPEESVETAAKLVPGQIGAIKVSEDAARQFGLQTATAESSAQPALLEFPGTLILDSGRLSHVHARFAGEVVEVGPAADQSRVLGFGDSVEKGQLLAIIWSRELGEKKSELVDALSQFRIDEETRVRLVKASEEFAVSDRTVREAERRVEADRIAVARVIRTLETWRVDKKEIDAVRDEARRLSKDPGQTRDELVHQWARLEVRAPLSGVILESNVTPGDLVDTNLDLFKIADLSRLRVVVHAYEEDLAALDAIPTGQRRWSIRVGADRQPGAFAGVFDQIGRIIDPNQHTALVMGWVDNKDGRLRVGQYITAAVEIPSPKNEVAVPASALVEQGDRHLLFVQPDGKDGVYVQRRVVLARRAGSAALVRGEPTPDQMRRGAEPLRAGERVVTSGAVQLKSALSDLQSSAVSSNN